jgi:hypothetical protein
MALELIIIIATLSFNTQVLAAESFLDTLHTESRARECSAERLGREVREVLVDDIPDSPLPKYAGGVWDFKEHHC